MGTVFALYISNRLHILHKGPFYMRTVNKVSADSAESTVNNSLTVPFNPATNTLDEPMD